MAGDFEIAQQVCRKYCYEKGLCVNIHPTNYIYTGGEEAGFVVELINYPRFPSKDGELRDMAVELGDLLLRELWQSSYTLMGQDQTEFRSRFSEIRNRVK
jgi:hypothetical protein